MKSFDTTPGEVVSDELDQGLPGTANSTSQTQLSDARVNGSENGTVTRRVSEEAGTVAVVDVDEVSETQSEIADVSEVGVVPETELVPEVTSAEVMPASEEQTPPDEQAEEQEPGADVPGNWLTRDRLIGWLPYGAVVLLGALLRFWDLGAKPLHHDESLHAYFALGLLHNLQHWGWCIGLNNPPAGYSCYTYDPLLHGPFQFHAIALVYQISQWLGAPDNGVNTTTVRIAAALLGTVLIALPYFLRDYLGRLGTWLAMFCLAVSPSMVYFSRFAREDIYMACFTLLLVVAVGRYIRTRKMYWLLLAAAGFVLSYATSEATFLTIAIFGSFLGALIVWEIGAKFRLQERVASTTAGRYLPRTFGIFAVLVYFIIVGIAAKFFFGLLSTLSTYINANNNVANVDLSNLETATVKTIPWLGILLGLYIFSILVREMYGNPPTEGRHGLARLVNRRQPVLDTILTMSWTHWFFALILGWAIFVFLFSVVFTNIAGGIGDGIWKGLYYWLEQQNVARGGQPWYYYLMVIPLYEQIGVVFAVVGIIRSFMRPSAFRLFLVYWFLGNFFIYSWAGEKMPWLTIFITMPMMLLAAIGLEPCIRTCYELGRDLLSRRRAAATIAPIADELEATDEVGERVEERELVLARSGSLTRNHPPISTWKAALGIFGTVMALLLLAPTIHNMYELAYIHPADGPYEMMVYVQTTNDVTTVMNHIDEIDQKDFSGNHQMRIAITSDATWPFAWYLRDYPNLCYGYPASCPTWKDNVPVVIAGGDDPYGDISNFAPAKGNYLYHLYQMRSWWDEGYKLPACVGQQKPGFTCADPSQGSGVGPGLWLSYGDTPPLGAKFNLSLATQRIWNWWWNRVPFGSTTGAYDMELFVQKNLGVNP